MYPRNVGCTDAEAESAECYKGEAGFMKETPMRGDLCHRPIDWKLTRYVVVHAT